MAEPARPYSPKTLAQHWGVNTQTVRRRIADGSLRAFRVGRAYRIPRAEVAAFEERNETCPPADKDTSDGAALGENRRFEARMLRMALRR